MLATILDAALFEGLSEEDSEFVVTCAVEHRYARGQTLFHSGDAAQGMYVIRSGSVRIYLENEDNALTLGHQFEGECIGELEVLHFGSHRLASVAAMEATICYEISKDNMERIVARCPVIMRRIFYVVSERLAQADRKLSYLAFMDVSLKVANVILELDRNLGICDGGRRVVKRPFTHQQLADLIGVSRESATRALQDLADAQLITWENKRIVLLDVAQLRCVAKAQVALDSTALWHNRGRYTYPD